MSQLVSGMWLLKVNSRLLLDNVMVIGGSLKGSVTERLIGNDLNIFYVSAGSLKSIPSQAFG